MDKRLVFLSASFLLLVAAPTMASNFNELRNTKGSVSYQHPDGFSHTLAKSAAVDLKDSDIAVTGAASIATVTLQDSSRVTMGENSKVQLVSFEQAETTSANFIIVNGKLRFKVEHPSGAKANYVFKTPTTTISVRGTEGDLSYDEQDGMRINVYNLGDPTLPVEVSLDDGTKFTVKAGQKLWVRLVDGVLKGEVSKLTQQAIDRFNQFGAPSRIDQFKEDAKDKVNSLMQSIRPHLP